MPLCLQLFRVFSHQGMVELDDNFPAGDVCDAEVYNLARQSRSSTTDVQRHEIQCLHNHLYMSQSDPTSRLTSEGFAAPLHKAYEAPVGYSRLGVGKWAIRPAKPCKSKRQRIADRRIRSRSTHFRS